MVLLSFEFYDDVAFFYLVFSTVAIFIIPATFLKLYRLFGKTAPAKEFHDVKK